MAPRTTNRYALLVNGRPLETELKIPVEDLASVRDGLSSLGARQQHPAEREINTLFDTDDRQLLESASVLRLRRHGSRKLLTFKGPPAYRGAIKERVELELEITDGETMRLILEQLGLQLVARYEKDRESWTVGDVQIELDHTPMGDFVEIEGPPEKLETVARGIGLDPDQAVRGSYLGLWHDHRCKNPDDDLPIDMVFEG